MSIFPGISATYWNTRATANRRVKPFILAAIHITDNSALMSAMNEAIYSNRVGTGASFTFVNNRNGTTVQCLHPEWQIPFTNGSWNRANRNLWTVNYAIQYGIGANDSTFMTIENVGRESIGAPLTDAQIEKCAQLIAHGSKLTGIKPSRATVLGHRDYDSYNRYNCPTRGNLDYLLGRIINRANQILTGTTPAPTPPSGVLNMPSVPGYVPPAQGKVGKGINLRTTPNHTVANVYKQTDQEYFIGVCGTVTGTTYNGSNKWLLCFIFGRFVYVHKSLVRNITLK
jgi:hypothetical protein